MRYTCCQRRRLRVVKQAGELNGVEYLEVAATAPTDPLRQRTLLLRLLKPATGLTAEHVRIEGGERIPTVGVEWAARADAVPSAAAAFVATLGLDQKDHVLVVRTVEAGDFSYYTARIVAGVTSEAPHPTFDPLLASVRFAFKIDCATGFDCRAGCTCGHDQPAGPELDYLAKDYPGLRRLLLGRLSLVCPPWRERNPADLGMALVELLAYEGDRLSYRQDATATEAYLGTARSRVSLRRHARLVDYRMHDGCSARVLLRCTPEETGAVKLPRGTRVYSSVAGLPPRLTAEQEHVALTAGAMVFETVEPAVLYAAHTSLEFYTWGDDECCLPPGSTSATLLGDLPNLKAGDLLVIAEIRSPTSGAAADADPARRWPVRLTWVGSAKDPSGGRFLDEPTHKAVEVTEIAWDPADALPFPACVSAKPATGPVSVAWGNIVVADHGRAMPAEELGAVPAPHLSYSDTEPACGVTHPGTHDVPARFRPRLRFGPLTRSVRVMPRIIASADPDGDVLTALKSGQASDAVRSWLAGYGVVFRHGPVVVRGVEPEWSVSNGVTLVRIRLDGGRMVVLDRPIPASRVTAGTPELAVPAIELTGTSPLGTDSTWHVRWDLLASTADATDFAVETEHDGTAFLRFGDGREDGGHGRRPEQDTTFTARYRTGNGRAGNVGAHTLRHIATTAAVTAVTNPLPAAGGREPQTAEEVRRDAPAAYLVQERAVTPADWAEVATRDPQIQRAVATWRWTGSWHTVFLTVDRVGAADVDPVFEREQRARLERYRLAGYDLELDGPRYVPVELGLHVCVEPDCLRSVVRRELLATLTAQFHPDRLTFAQPVYLSPICAAAQAVPGVASVTVHTFRRQHAPAVSGVADGVLPMGRLEIARLDNNPNFPERGVISLTVGGGR